MPEHALEELQKLAQSALRHAELIDIAGTNSPNQAFERAMVRWPRRQATATRFLAILRRDYGQGAFDTLTSSTEHARPYGSEHARGETMMSTENLMDTLYPKDVNNVVLGHNLGRSFNVDDLALERMSSEGDTTVKLSEECQKLQLDEVGRQTLIRRIVNGMLKHWAKPEAPKLFYGRHWGVAVFAVRTLLPEDKALYKQVLLAALVYLGAHAKHVISMIRELLPNPQENSTLQDVINHALASGCTEEEVLNAWGQMIDMREKEGFLTCVILGWCEGAKETLLTVNGKSVKTVLEPVTRKRLLYELKDTLVNGCWEDWRMQDGIRLQDLQYNIALVGKLIRLTDCNWRWSSEVKEEVEEMFVTCFAAGRASIAANVLSLFGGEFRLWSDMDRGSYTPCLQRLLRGAQALAEEKVQFGIASAIAEHLKDFDNADRLRTIARKQNQPVTLSFGFCVPFKK